MRILDDPHHYFDRLSIDAQYMVDCGLYKQFRVLPVTFRSCWNYRAVVISVVKKREL